MSRLLQSVERSFTRQARQPRLVASLPRARLSTYRVLCDTSTSPKAYDVSMSHVLSGAAGALFALTVGYGLYRSSDLYGVVQKAKKANQMLDSTKSTIESTASVLKGQSAPADLPKELPVNPQQILTFLRSTLSPMVSGVPGASHLLDSTLDELEAFAKSHAKEAEKLLRETYDEVQSIWQKMDGRWTAAGAQQLYSVLQRAYNKMKKEVSSTVGKLKEKGVPTSTSDVLQGLYKAYPALKEQLSGSGGGALEAMLSSSFKDADGLKQLKEYIEKVIKQRGGVSKEAIADIETYVKDHMPDFKKVWTQWQSTLPEAMRNHPRMKQFMEQAQAMTKDIDPAQVQKLMTDFKDIIDSLGQGKK